MPARLSSDARQGQLSLRAMPEIAVRIEGDCRLFAGSEAWEPYLRWRPGANTYETIATVRLAILEGCVWNAKGRSHQILLHQGHPGAITASTAIMHVINENLGTHYHVDLDALPTVSMTLCLGSNSTHGLDAFQVVRGLLLGAAIRRGAVPVHGAVLDVGGAGVLMVGPKGAGKTSFALSALRRAERTAFITNDKAMLLPGGTVVAGLPYAVAIGAGTMSQLPELMSAEVRWSGGKLMMWPAEVAQRLGRAPDVVADLSEVWVCQLKLGKGTVHYGPASAEVREVGLAAVREFSHAMSPGWLFDLIGWDIPDGEAGNLCDLPWFTVTGDPWGRWNPQCQNKETHQ